LAVSSTETCGRQTGAASERLKKNLGELDIVRLEV
jgi:hypothetical protein